MIKEDILDILQKDESLLNPEKVESLKSLKEFSQEEITSMFDTLYREEPEETGGQNAMTGYYFQLLTSLYYLAEVLEGKWDFIALELHQDIIVGNQDTIRFIQVKSKVLEERVYVEKVTKINLYRGWLQKLLPMARFFPKDSGKETQFELITNFLICNSDSVNMEHYLFNNSNFNLPIDDSDDLVKKVKENPSKVDGKQFNYYNECGESEAELLSRFSVTPITTNADIKDFVHTVSSKFGGLVTESARLTFEDINFLIGELFYLCTHNNEKGALFIDRTKAEEYLSILKKRVSDKLQPFFNAMSSDKIIDGVISSVHKELNHMKLNESLLDQLIGELECLRNELKAWARKERYALELLNRYIEAKEYSLLVVDLDDISRTTRYLELFKTLYILKLTFNKEIIFSTKFQSLLIKEIDDYFISTLGLDMGDTKEDGIEKLISAIIKTPRDQQLQMIVKNHFTIFQGEYDDEFVEGDFLRIDEFFEPQIPQFGTEEGLLEVDNEWVVLPGLRILSGMKKAKGFKNLEDYQTTLIDLWGKIQPTK
ncbi:dsDNA nuclease domain-containing protein [Bacillus infantis]|uniref:dsDNA nuclease domain-containing protein n=1 Tax=Bacillus infantis TaxID=324767 RepID=UPI001CD7324F|nr:dsDNA nuclease domain-containing protein [Bacillus infantis]MCA1042237.1 dsDNA nuclease domain-containing protein [Bacillus infantis]